MQPTLPKFVKVFPVFLTLVHDKFNKGRTDSVPVPVIDEEYVDDYQKEHGVRRSDAGLELAKEA